MVHSARTLWYCLCGPCPYHNGEKNNFCEFLLMAISKVKRILYKACGIVKVNLFLFLLLSASHPHWLTDYSVCVVFMYNKNVPIVKRV